MILFIIPQSDGACHLKKYRRYKNLGHLISVYAVVNYFYTDVKMYVKQSIIYSANAFKIVAVPSFAVIAKPIAPLGT